MAEAQRLIAVSLGKIAHNRGQRGGASLYKNLLVSTVLHKARHVFIQENFSAMMQVSEINTFLTWIYKTFDFRAVEYILSCLAMIMINQESIHVRWGNNDHDYGTHAWQLVASC